MAIRIDHNAARQALHEEFAKAGEFANNATSREWKDMTDRLGELCPHRKSSTFIAALGTAILAKCVNSQVDTFSLLEREGGENAYSARSLADGVWAKERGYLGIDIGGNGANPLNNTPFIGRSRIDAIENVRNKEGKDYLFFCLDRLASIETTGEARIALRGFIASRARNFNSKFNVGHNAGDHLITKTLAGAIDEFVRNGSEDGRRAQAAAAGLLSCVYGPLSVDVGHINDPDRRLPLDITVFKDAERLEIHLSIEVKDKPVTGPEILSSTEKVSERGFTNIIFLAVSKGQKQFDFEREVERARDSGCRINIFLSWLEFCNMCIGLASEDGPAVVGKTYREIGVRLEQIGVSEQGMNLWQKFSERQNPFTT